MISLAVSPAVSHCASPSAPLDKPSLGFMTARKLPSIVDNLVSHPLHLELGVRPHGPLGIRIFGHPPRHLVGPAFGVRAYVAFGTRPSGHTVGEVLVGG